MQNAVDGKCNFERDSAEHKLFFLIFHDAIEAENGINFFGIEHEIVFWRKIGLQRGRVLFNFFLNNGLLTFGFFFTTTKRILKYPRRSYRGRQNHSKKINCCPNLFWMGVSSFSISSFSFPFLWFPNVCLLMLENAPKRVFRAEKSLHRWSIPLTSHNNIFLL